MTLSLNLEQREAVEHGEGPLLVVAGPGTGKTRVITQRVVHLIERGPGDAGPLPPQNILALTFTDKAAEEMKRRVAEALPGLAKPPFIATFHAFCLHVLRRRRVDHRLLDKVDVWIFLRRRMAELGLEFYQKLAEPGAFLHDLNEFFARCQDELIEPEDFEGYVRVCEERFFERYPSLAGAAISEPPRPATAGFPPLEQKGLRGGAPVRIPAHQKMSPEERLEWEEILKKRELERVFSNSRRLIDEAGASSLGSLVSETVALWRSRPAALDEARAEFRAVLVDEFQDTNYAQVELLKLLVPPPYFITAVGDDDQAIYRFRGASHGAFEMFHQAFPGHATVYLNRNYRSTKRILRAAGTVICRNDRYAAKPPLAAQCEEGVPVRLLKSHDAVSEAVWVAEEIERLARRDASYGSVAVLYRAHHNRDLLVEEFRRRGIPFDVRGLSILSVTVLRDLIAYLKLIASPHDNISLTRALLAPRWKFPEEFARAVRAEAAKDRCSLYGVLQRNQPAGFHRSLAETGWSELEEVLGDLGQTARRVPVTALIDLLLERLGWRYLPGSRELAYLERFRKFAADWEEKSETRRLAEFVEYFDYFVEAGGKIEAPESNGRSDAVQMMTVHAAKGLEFPIVFVIGVAARRFPVTDRKAVIEFPAELRKGPRPPTNIHVQEERRLFFVALTRARERLYVSGFAKTPRQQSAFVDDLLADAAVAARSIEIIEVPDAASATRGRGVTSNSPPSHVAAKVLLSETVGQGRLFGASKNPGPFHAVLADWAGSPAPLDGKLRLSATAIEDYRDCPLKYKLQHVLKIPAAPQAALTFGNLMHASVRHYFELRRTGLPEFSEIEQFYREHWKSAGFDDAYQEETYRKAGLEQLRAFVERWNEEPMDGNEIQMEVTFRFDLGDVELEGRIDQLRELREAGEQCVKVTDYKTGRPRTQKDADKSLQLSVYALAARRALGLKPVRLSFYNLTSNESVPTARTPEELEEAERKIREAVAEIRGGQFPPKPGFICRWCAYQTLCPAHED